MPSEVSFERQFFKKFIEMADVPIDGSLSGCERDHYKNLNNFFITEQISGSHPDIYDVVLNLIFTPFFQTYHLDLPYFMIIIVIIDNFV